VIPFICITSLFFIYFLINTIETPEELNTRKENENWKKKMILRKKEVDKIKLQFQIQGKQPCKSEYCTNETNQMYHYCHTCYKVWKNSFEGVEYYAKKRQEEEDYSQIDSYTFDE